MSVQRMYIPNGIGASHVALAHTFDDHNSQNSDAGCGNDVPDAKAVGLARPARSNTPEAQTTQEAQAKKIYNLTAMQRDKQPCWQLPQDL